MPAINALGYGGMNAGWQQSYYASKISAAKTAAANPSQPEIPVEPVSPVRRVAPDTAVRMPVAVQEPRIPTEDDLNNAADNLARMRIQRAEEPKEADTAEETQSPEAQEAAKAANAPEEAPPAEEQDMAQAGFNKNLMNPAGVS